MKQIPLFLVCCLAVIAPVQAADEALFETIEAPRVIVNWNPRESRLGTLLVYRCGDCEMLTLSIDRDTRLTRHGETLDIATLARKADWAAHVTRSSRLPDRAVAIAIFD